MRYPMLDADAPYPLSRKVVNDAQQHRAAARRHVAAVRQRAHGGARRLRPLLRHHQPRPDRQRGADQRPPHPELRRARHRSRARRSIPNLLATGDAAFSTPPSITVFPEDFEIDVRAPGQRGDRASVDRSSARVGELQLLGTPRRARTRTTSISDRSSSTLADGRPVYTGIAESSERAVPGDQPGGEQGPQPLSTGVDLTLRQRITRRRAVERHLQLRERARSIGDMEGGALMDPSDPERDWGPSPGDVRHTVSAQATLRAGSRCGRVCAG